MSNNDQTQRKNETNKFRDCMYPASIVFEKKGMTKLYAHLKTMTKSPLKFQKNQHKTLGLVAHTRYTLYINFKVKMPEK